MRYTVCEARRNSPALLFETLDTEKVAALPELEKIFSNGYFVTQVGERNPERRSWYNTNVADPPDPKYCVLVSTHIAEQLPDAATIDSADLRFFIGGKPYALNLRRRYNQCLSLFKAVGCAHCPDKGMKCLSEGVGVELPDRLSPAHEAEDLWDHMRENFPKFGEFTLVKPGATRTESFSKAIRPYWEHDFDAAEKNHKTRSEASQQGAATKKFKREQCSKCVISKSCDRASRCKGAYPPEADIVKQCNDELGAVLKDSAWPEWQLWEVARGMGEEAKHSRFNIVLTGLKLQGSDGLRATVHRAKSSITEYGKLETYEEIAKTFGLALTESGVRKNRGPLTDPDLRATLWLALNSHRAHQSYGWGCRRYVAGLGIGHDCVRVMWTNGSYINYHKSELCKISDVAAHMTDGYLGNIQKVEVR